MLTEEEIKRLWNNKEETFTEDELLYACWHRRLRHRNKKDVKRLADKGIMPKRLAKIKRAPLCAECIFAKAHK